MMNTKLKLILIFFISCFFSTHAIAKSADIDKALKIVEKVFKLEGMAINNNQKSCIKKQFSTYLNAASFKKSFPDKDFVKFSKLIDTLDLNSLRTKEDINKYPDLMGLGFMSQKCFKSN